MNIAEDILIGTWLQGERLEDLSHVDPKYFEFSAIVRELKRGLPLDDIYLSHKELRADLIRWTTINAPALYESSYRSLIDQQTRDQVKLTDDLGKIQELIALRDSYFTEPIAGFRDYASSYMNEMKRKETQELIKWDGVPSLQEMTIGLKRKELTAIAARPSVGKSAFALQMAYGAWKQGAKVLYFPLEMSATQTFGRILVKEGYIEPKENQTGKVRDYNKYMLGVDLLNEMEKSGRFLIYEGEGQIEAIEEIIKREEPYLVVIDQLTQMKANVPFKDIRMQFSYMTSNLKRMAMQHNVSISLLCQINRNADNTEPTLANLKESGSIEEDSDNVLLMHRLRPQDVPEEKRHLVDWDNIRPMIFNLAKQRDGETGKFDVIFRPARMTFYEEARI